MYRVEMYVFVCLLYLGCGANGISPLCHVEDFNNYECIVAKGQYPRHGDSHVVACNNQSEVVLMSVFVFIVSRMLCKKKLKK